MAVSVLPPSPCSVKQQFQNPVIPGFAPDPSVVLVNGTFFLVTSSFHIFPGIPIYASKDLKSWTHIGNAINRREQVDLTMSITKAVKLHAEGTMIGAAGLFAPTIRYHNGTFHIVCTNVGEEGDDFHGDNFYVSTTDIWNSQWSDPKPLEFRGIDPSLFIDDDGRAYIQGAWRLDRTEQPYSTIKQYEIDLSTGKRLSEVRELWPGSARIYTEGPHIYKKDAWYYLLVAEGGTFENHMLSIARSANLWGPYEECPQNPILTAFGKSDELVRDVGHGELFQDAHGLWWATVLGVRKINSRYPLGRETFLAPVEWPEGDWPRIQHPTMQFERVMPRNGEVNGTSFQQHHRIDDCYIRIPAPSDYQWSGNTVRLTPTLKTLAAAQGTASFVGKRQRSLRSSAAVKLHISKECIGKDVVAGLALYKDDFRSAFIAVDFAKSCVRLEQRRLRDSTNAGDVIHAEGSIDLASVEHISFRIDATETKYEFQYKAAHSLSWTALGSIDTLDMTCRDFTGTIWGPFAYACSERDISGEPFLFEGFTVDLREKLGTRSCI